MIGGLTPETPIFFVDEIMQVISLGLGPIFGLDHRESPNNSRPSFVSYFQLQRWVFVPCPSEIGVDILCSLRVRGVIARPRLREGFDLDCCYRRDIVEMRNWLVLVEVFCGRCDVVGKGVRPATVRKRRHCLVEGWYKDYVGS